ncbi:MAG: type III-B CRISPR-associated protein Cas10/Cmr2 [Candidatus Diapherotrites archaeon]|nr:type III-B CRISPR-associated protein Cas10/Cmr2 [Candidatus Diapherotrites archaeon]
MMTQSQQILFLITLGQVQDFIATARTSQDLWFGSWMLSELAKAAALVLAENGAELVFPNPSTLDELKKPGFNASNKIVAMVSGNSTELAKTVESRIRKRLSELAAPGLRRVPEKYQQRAYQQVDDLLEFYWASARIEQNNYATARKRAEAALAARKNTREFKPWSIGAEEEKSSLDGFREKVLKGPKNEDTALLSQGEVLSGVDAIKRFGTRKGAKFRSTSDFAAAPFRQGLGNLDAVVLAEIKTLLKQYTDETETDGAYYFVERLTRFLPESNKDTFRKAYQEVFKKHGVKESPSPYYTLLRADGDFMGRTIDTQKTKEDHQKLSRTLSNFAQKARDIIEREHQGQAVYIGGDDILAYLPLHTALACVAELDKAFSHEMQFFAYEDDAGERHHPTLSAGLVVAHHLTPLSDVLDAARRAEHKAKDHTPEKHGLAILVLKRGSGESLAVGPMSELLERMRKMTELRANGTLSHGAAYELRELADFLQKASLEKKEVFAKEATRILRRKKEAGGTEKAKEEIIQLFEGWLEQIDLAELATEMIIGAEFARAWNLAHPTVLKEATG